MRSTVAKSARGRRSRVVAVIAASVAIVFVSGTATDGRRQMPDPKEIAGMPLPVGDLENGTVVVRVIRGALSNNIPDQDVELTGAGTPRKVRTDANGRAQFPGLAAGARVRAVATVGGERLESQEFPVPATGGVRLLLVATDPAATARPGDERRLAAGPAQPGVVVLGDQSRFVVELGDGSLSVFCILQILNTSKAPVAPAQPLVFDLPRGSTGASILANSSPQAAAAEKQVTVAGPFAPGTTLVQFAYSMPYSSGDLTIEQVMPVPLSRLVVLAQKTGDMRLTSRQVSEQREMAAEGQTYILGQGPAVPAGGVVAFSFQNLPHEARWPRYVALGLAAAILAAGAWVSRRPVGADAGAGALRRLEAKRSQLFDALTAVETQHREGRLDPDQYAARRQEIVTALERVYAALDRQAA
jgi:hypothetical protein